ncbi:MAG TPA: hypothetical protein PKE00_14985, partial [Planctomycetota bacterium]|nr:hypothetical protein [Planctomycetota bacterium]
MQPGTRSGSFVRLGSSLICAARTYRDGLSLLAVDPVAKSHRILLPELRTLLLLPFEICELGATRAIFVGSDASNFPVLGVTDGTRSGTQFLKRLSKTPSLIQLTSLGSRVLFIDGIGTALGSEPYITDGTPQGTQLVKDLAPGSESSYCVVLGVDPTRSRALLAAQLRTGPALVVTDGSPAGTVTLTPARDFGLDAGIAWLDSKRFVFQGRDTTNGAEPWVSDGTPNGTKQIADLRVGVDSSTPQRFITLGGRAYFRASDGQSFSLYSTDGSSVTKHVVLGGLASRQFEEPTLYQGRIYFTSSTPAHGIELFSTDGTAQGTGIVADLELGAASSEPRTLTVAGSSLYFSA